MKRLLMISLMLMVPILLVSWLYSRPETRRAVVAAEKKSAASHTKRSRDSGSSKFRSKAKPQSTKDPLLDELPYLSLLQTLGTFGELLMKNYSATDKGSAKSSDSLDLLQSLLFSEPTKKAKSSDRRTADKKSRDRTPSFVEETRTSILSHLTEIANDENGKMLLELFQGPGTSDEPRSRRR